VSLIFGVIGSYTDRVAEDMFRAMAFRSPDREYIVQRFEGGFIAGSAQKENDPLSDGDTPLAVWDGYIGTGHGNQKIMGTGAVRSALTGDGSSGLQGLWGSFSAAGWNPKSRSLYLIRDAAGSRPLYYAAEKETLVFASSPKAILATPLISRELNPEGVSLYLSMIAVPDPVTIFHRIRTVPSGCYITFCDGMTDVKRYWTPPWHQESEPSESEEELAADLRSSLECAVLDAIPSESDSAGYFLSGGTDTSSIVGIAARNGIDPIHTYTIGYEGMGGGYADFNEFYYAKLVADRYRTTHHEASITPADILTALPGIVSCLDQPSGDAINSYLVSRTVPDKHRFVLTGTGGDEIFIGSHWYKHQLKLIRLLQYWQLVPKPFRSTGKFLSEAYPFLPFSSKIRACKRLENGVPGQYGHIKLLFSNQEKQTLFTDAFRDNALAGLSSSEIIGQYDQTQSGCDDLNRMAGLLIQHEVTNLQLRDLDTMCHANGLEARSPLMDRRVLESLARAPGRMKAPDGQLRHLMFRALPDVLPEETKTRKKMSFIVPMDLWARRELKALIDLTCSPDVIRKRGIFDVNAVQTIHEAFFHTRKELHSFKLWVIVLFELWCRMNIDNSPGSSPPQKITDLF